MTTPLTSGGGMSPDSTKLRKSSTDVFLGIKLDDMAPKPEPALEVTVLPPPADSDPAAELLLPVPPRGISSARLCSQSPQ